MSDLEPSSSLHTKLRDLLADSGTIKHCCGQRGTNDIDSDIAQILQALTDAGYKSPSEVDGIIYEYKHYQALALIGKMTGQEFYDRFKAEYANTLNYDSQPAGIKTEVLEAAKRAVGVSDE